MLTAVIIQRTALYFPTYAPILQYLGFLAIGCPYSVLKKVSW